MSTIAATPLDSGPGCCHPCFHLDMPLMLSKGETVREHVTEVQGETAGSACRAQHRQETRGAWVSLEELPLSRATSRLPLREAASTPRGDPCHSSFAPAPARCRQTGCRACPSGPAGRHCPGAVAAGNPGPCALAQPPSPAHRPLALSGVGIEDVKALELPFPLFAGGLVHGLDLQAAQQSPSLSSRSSTTMSSAGTVEGCWSSSRSRCRRHGRDGEGGSAGHRCGHQTRRPIEGRGIRTVPPAGQR